MAPQRLHAETNYFMIICRYSPILLATVSANNRKPTMKKSIPETLTDEQRAILVGLLLGDGHLETRNNGQTYRLKVEHSATQADYSEWLLKQFQQFCEQTSVYQRVRADGRVSVGFTSKTSGIFRFYAQQFYVDKKKRIPPLLHKLLSPQAVAVWFMDDGSRKSKVHKTYNIHTLGYTRSDLLVAQKALEKKFGIKVTLHKQKDDSWRLYIGADTASVFTSLVKPYVTIIPSMRKKLVTHMPKM